VTEVPASTPGSSNPLSNPGAPARIIQSDALLQGEREVAIQHGNEIYRLRLTKTGKLILNK
jgi:hemin uptake protein HemP